VLFDDGNLVGNRVPDKYRPLVADRTRAHLT
jgi:hypothetical protein